MLSLVQIRSPMPRPEILQTAFRASASRFIAVCRLSKFAGPARRLATSCWSRWGFMPFWMQMIISTPRTTQMTLPAPPQGWRPDHPAAMACSIILDPAMTSAASSARIVMIPLVMIPLAITSISPPSRIIRARPS